MDVKKTTIIRLGFAAIALSIFSGVIGLLWYQENAKKTNATEYTIPEEVDSSFSAGDKLIFTEGQHSAKLAGIEAYRQGHYEKAQGHFLEALRTENPDPETLIYFNNTRIVQREEYVTIGAAIAVSESADSNFTQEILQGIAMAQKEFYEQGSYLKIVLGNDEADVAKGTGLAQEFVENDEILGVIGHSNSDVSLAAAEIYEQAKMPLVISVSTSTELSNTGDFIFRALPSDDLFAQTTAEDSLSRLQANRIIIFGDSLSSYSRSISNSMVEDFTELGGEVLDVVDMSADSFELDEAMALAEEVDAIALLPGSQTIDKAVAIIDANQNRQPIIAGDFLYRDEILEINGENALSLVFAVPWHALSNPSALFPVNARTLWGEDVTWRTAMAYDAAQAFMKALQNSAEFTRTSIQKKLADPEFVTKGAADEITFSPEGDRIHPLVIVTVKENEQSYSGFEFVPLDAKPQE